MAMASNPNRNTRGTDESSSARTSTRRVDPSHGPSNVPVLFRLKNLQRTQAAVPVESANAVHDSSPSSQQARSPVAVNSTSGTNAGQVPASNLASSTDNVAPSQPVSSDPHMAPGKRGVSNGFILLVVLVAVAFAMGRGSSRTPQVASNSAVSTTPAQAIVASVPTNAPSPTTSVPTTTVAPLTPPSLPVVASDNSTDAEQAAGKQEAPLMISAERDAGEAATQESLASTASEEASKDAPITIEDKSNKSKLESEKLPVPSMLVSTPKEPSQTEETFTFASQPNSSAPNDSQANAEIVLETNEPSNSLLVNEPTKPAEPAAVPTFGKPRSSAPVAVNESTKPPAPALASKLMATAMPEMDTTQLYEMRANFQSQMDALAKARQGQVQQTLVASEPQQNAQTALQQNTQTALQQNAQAIPQYAQEQAMAVGQALQAYTNVAPPMQGYGQAQSTYTPKGHQAYAVANQSGPQYTPPNPATAPVQYQSATHQVSVNPYVPIGKQVAYPSNVQPGQQTPAQAYQPMFTTPPANPAQGYGQPMMQQGAASPYPNSNPTLPSN